MAITSSNLDEFFMVRVATLHAQVLSGYQTKDASGLTPKEQLEKVLEKIHEFAQSQTKTCKKLFIELESTGAKFLRHNMLNSEQKDYCTRLFL